MRARNTFYNKEIRIFLRTNRRTIAYLEVSELFVKPYVKIQSAERAIKGFATTGVYPTRRGFY